MQSLAHFRLSLYRSLVLPFSLFVLLASLGLAGWISYRTQRDALREFAQLAQTNARFIDELQLPLSPALAHKLSTVLGVQVGFYTADGAGLHSGAAAWPDGLESAVEDAIAAASPAFQFRGYAAAVAPFGRQSGHLVLVRASRSFLAVGLGDAVLIPTLVMTLACGLLAYYLAHRIVRPLVILTHWLPHIQQEGVTVAAIPAAVAQRSDEIGELARALEATSQRLREEQCRRRQSERMATLGRIATSLAHEIRNPAASISLHADLLARDPNMPQSESIALIRSEVDRITGLVNQWLFVVRPAPPQCGRHDLVALVRRVSDNLSAALSHAGAAIRMQQPAAPLPVSCDQTRIEQVMRNLLVNALQAMPEGGEIRIHLEAVEDTVVCCIQDSGAGFSDAALQHFGEPFFSEREGGMGIGLTLACEVVEAHQGEITAANAAAGGAVVRVQLPLAPGHPATEL